MKKILFVLSCLLLPSIAFSQLGSYGLSDARTSGMGGTGNANAGGILPISRNPALMVSEKDSSYFQFTFPNFTTNAFASDAEISDLNYFFERPESNPLYLSDEDKQRFINMLGGDANIVGNFRMNLVSIAFMPSEAIGAFGFAVNDYFHARTSLPQSFLDLALYGNQPGRDYNFNELGINMSWTRSFDLRYSRTLIRDTVGFMRFLSGGVTVKFIQGLMYANVQTDEGTLTTDQNNFQLNGRFRATGRSAHSFQNSNREFFDAIGDGGLDYFTPAGTGLGADIGIYGITDGGLKFGISITDIGNISWSGNAYETNYSKEMSLKDVTNKKALDSLMGDLDKDISTAGFTSALPTALRIGLGYTLNEENSPIPGEMQLYFDYNQGFNKEISNDTRPRLSLGMDWEFSDYAPLITLGAFNDRFGGYHFSAGLGYRSSVLDVYLSTLDVLGAVGAESYFGAALTMVWKIF